MSVDMLINEAKELQPSELRTLVLNLTDLMDGSDRSEITAILESRRRAAAMKSGQVAGLSHRDTFDRARSALRS